MFPSSPFLGHSLSSGWNIFMLWDKGGFLEDAHMLPSYLLRLWSLFSLASFKTCWYCSWLFAPDLEVLSLETNYKLLCSVEKTLCFCVCARMHLAQDGWRVAIKEMKCEERIHAAKVDACRFSELHDASNCCTQSYPCLIQNNSHRNRCSAISQLNWASRKSTSTCPQARVTILLHGLIEWKISFQSSPHPPVAPHHPSSAL